MPKLPKIVEKRLISSVPKFKRILQKAKERDVNESDTVTIIVDILEQVFGFDKYSEITKEYCIQGQYCDLAVKLDSKVNYLVEVKAIGLDLKESHIRQAVTYAAREGIKWVALTNGINWEIHRVNLSEKVENEQVVSFDFLEINPRKNDDQQTLYLLCKRGVDRDLIDDLYEHKQSFNKYIVGSILLTDPILKVVKRELKKIKEGLKVEDSQIEEMLRDEVIKREIIESDATKEASKQIVRAQKKRIKKKSTHKTEISDVVSNSEDSDNM